MIHGMNKMRGRKSFFAIKVDLAKAYDKLSWEFIWCILMEDQIPEAMSNVIMHSVTSVETTVMWNGARGIFFVCSGESVKVIQYHLIYLSCVWINCLI